MDLRRPLGPYNSDHTHIETRERERVCVRKREREGGAETELGGTEGEERREGKKWMGRGTGEGKHTAR